MKKVKLVSVIFLYMMLLCAVLSAEQNYSKYKLYPTIVYVGDKYENGFMSTTSGNGNKLVVIALNGISTDDNTIRIYPKDFQADIGDNIVDISNLFICGPEFKYTGEQFGQSAFFGTFIIDGNTVTYNGADMRIIPGKLVIGIIFRINIDVNSFVLKYNTLKYNVNITDKNILPIEK